MDKLHAINNLGMYLLKYVTFPHSLTSHCSQFDNQLMKAGSSCWRYPLPQAKERALL